MSIDGISSLRSFFIYSYKESKHEGRISIFIRFIYFVSSLLLVPFKKKQDNN